jgi:hypothetical protein
MSFTASAIVFLASVALMVLAGQMAGTRHRSVRAWLWITAFVGPLGPLALFLLGNRRNGTSPAWLIEH